MDEEADKGDHENKDRGKAIQVKGNARGETVYAHPRPEHLVKGLGAAGNKIHADDNGNKGRQPDAACSYGGGDGAGKVTTRDDEDESSRQGQGRDEP